MIVRDSNIISWGEMNEIEDFEGLNQNLSDVSQISKTERNP